jgi:hypothetical protein
MCLDCPVCRSPEVVKVTIPVDEVLAAFMETYLPQKALRLPTIEEWNYEVEDVVMADEVDVSDAPAAVPGSKHKNLTSFRQLLNHCKPGSYVILDIDETILVHGYYPCMLLTNQGLGSMNYALQQKQGSSPASRAYVSNVYQKALYTRRPVETCTVDVIKELQDRGVKVFGLTARMGTTHARTNAELTKVGLDLKKTSPFPCSDLLTDPVTQAECREGIIYTSGRHKGQVLNRFLEGFLFRSLYEEAYRNGQLSAGSKTRYRDGVSESSRAKLPAEIVFVDDRVTNLDSVQMQLRSAIFFKIPITTYHYGRASYRCGAEQEGQVDTDYRLAEEFSGGQDSPDFDRRVVEFQLSYLMDNHVMLNDKQVYAVTERLRTIAYARRAAEESSTATAAAANDGLDTKVGLKESRGSDAIEVLLTPPASLRIGAKSGKAELMQIPDFDLDRCHREVSKC